MIDFGVAEVLPDRVTVLVRLAEKPEDIDIAAQEAAKREAEAEMGKATSLEEADRARLALLTALMKMRAAERAQHRR